MRRKTHVPLSAEQRQLELDQDIYHKVVRLTGGRLAFLGKAASAPDMLEAAQQMLENESSWMLNHIGLIPDHDDDVMDEVRCLSW
jgi:hypothetical protein